MSEFAIGVVVGSVILGVIVVVMLQRFLRKMFGER